MNTIIKQATTTLLLSGAIALFGCSSDDAAPPAPPIGDISGVWAIEDTSVSQTAGCSDFSTYDLVVAQSGNAVTVTDAALNVFTGTLNGNTLTWSGTYPEPPGTVSNNVTITIGATCTTLTGTSTWSYTEPGFSCSGTGTATGTRTSGGTSC